MNSFKPKQTTQRPTTSMGFKSPYAQQVRFSDDSLRQMTTTTSSSLMGFTTPSSARSIAGSTQSLVPLSGNNAVVSRASSMSSLNKMVADAEAAAKPLQPTTVSIAPGTDLTTVNTIDDYVLFGGQASFGLVYEHNLYERIHRYMDIMAIDDICYYGDGRSSIPTSLEKKFSLFKPITFVSFPPTASQVVVGEHIPAPMGHGDFRISSPIQLYFSLLSRNQSQQFQHIIINWSEVCAPGITIADLERLFYHVKRCLTDTGKVLCIARPGDATTLPIFNSALEFFKNTECPTSRAVLAAMHTAGFNVHWSIDILPAVLPVRKWLAMIRNYFPPQLALMDTEDVKRGVLELNDGMFRYQPNLVEFSDRLLFVIGAAAAEPTRAVIQRLGQPSSGVCDFGKYDSALTTKIDPKKLQRAQLFPSTIPREVIYEIAVDDLTRPYLEQRLQLLNKKKKLDKREYGFF